MLSVTKPPRFPARRIDALVRDAQRSPKKSDNRHSLPDRFRRGGPTVVRKCVQCHIDFVVSLQELVVIDAAAQQNPFGRDVVLLEKAVHKLAVTRRIQHAVSQDKTALGNLLENSAPGAKSPRH